MEKEKEYNRNCNVILEDEYLNGKRNGKGKEYDNYGKLIFEGEYLNGKMEKERNMVEIMEIHYLGVNI